MTSPDKKLLLKVIKRLIRRYRQQILRYGKPDEVILASKIEALNELILELFAEA